MTRTTRNKRLNKTWAVLSCLVESGFVGADHLRRSLFDGAELYEANRVDARAVKMLTFDHVHL